MHDDVLGIVVGMLAIVLGILLFKPEAAAWWWASLWRKEETPESVARSLVDLAHTNGQSALYGLRVLRRDAGAFEVRYGDLVMVNGERGEVEYEIANHLRSLGVV